GAEHTDRESRSSEEPRGRELFEPQKDAHRVAGYAEGHRMRAMTSTDFMPISGWDHLELWVGNAKQAAYFYEHAFGFDRVAYAGPETGVRDRASYVLEQGEIRLVLTSAMRADHEV